MTACRTLRDERQPFSFAGLTEWETKAAWLRRQLGVSLGQFPAPPTPSIQGERFDRWEGPDYSCEKVAIESLPGFFLTGNLFRPLKSEQPMPVMLCPHGHWPDGRLHDHDQRGSVPARCIHLARMGIAVFAYDMVGYNDSCQLNHTDTPEDPLWGFGMMGLQTWNSRIALEFMLALPNIDPARVGITGASGGGTQSFVMMALDERLTAAAPICMISLAMQGGCVCENAPLLRHHATNVDIAALFAPKPLFLGSCTGDWTAKTPERERPAMERVYDLYDAAASIDSCHVDADHNYNLELRQAVYAFFARTFFPGDDRPTTENPYAPRPPLPKRLVWWGREAPESLSTEAIHELWRSRQEAALAPTLSDPQRIRRELVPLLPHALGLSPNGESLDGESEQLDLQQSGHTLTVNGAPPIATFPKDVAHPECYNNPPFLRQVHAIRRAIQETDCHTLKGDHGAGPACLVAATQLPQLKNLEVDLRDFNPADDNSWQATFPTPFIRQVGGMPTLRTALSQLEISARGLPDGTT